MLLLRWVLAPGAALASTLGALAATAPSAIDWTPVRAGVPPLASPSGNPDCPPCFNCHNPGNECTHFGGCDEFSGMCECPPGFAGADCAEPACGSLPKGARRPVREPNATCQCDDGWAGVNCNMCTRDAACAAMVPAGEPGTCYAGGRLVRENFHMCNVTNRKILDVLKGREAEVSFGCSRNDSRCDLQLWVDRLESFYCRLSDCDFDAATGSNNGTAYSCQSIACECVPGRLLCGADGAIDLSEWLQKSIRGPGNLDCDADGRCGFTEPELNKLVRFVFGDDHISLACSASECMHYSEVPGYAPPQHEISLVAAVAAVVFVFAVLASVIFGARSLFRRQEKTAAAGIPTEPTTTVNANPLSLQFENVTYVVGGRSILRDISGAVAAGEVLAIMGGSGAGKTTLLDILARKNKRGTTGGQLLVNGASVSLKTFRRLAGFVDQDDELLPTLTVYETVVASALLRLPRSMSAEAKRMRALDTLSELGILHLRDRLIGSEADRGLSGGEKRRVAIACEVVTSPSILLLDEPTSGLDAFNAFNVVDSLVTLARDYKRTVILTIHQPRSNIVSLFNRLLLLADGRLVFSGAPDEASTYFESIGHRCPPGYNIADFMIDLTMRAKQADLLQPAYRDEEPGVADEGLPRTGGEPPSDADPDEICADPELHENPLIDDPVRRWQDTAYHREQIQRATEAAAHGPGSSDVRGGLTPLVTSFSESAYALKLRREIQQVKERTGDTLIDEGYQRISLWSQFTILSDRTFKNLYRNPMLVFTHYLTSVALALFCGLLYFHVKLDISGFQNRLGLFFFLLTLFGFSTLTTISLFSHERLVFVRERANGYYNPFAYYCAKVLLDIIPLRVVPPLLLGIIVYPLVGLNAEDGAPLKFLAILVLFNLSAATIMLTIGILIHDFAVATLVGSLVNLFGIVFAGLFLNQDTMSPAFAWMKLLSIYHYAYEALSVNEVRYLSLTETKFGLSIEVPGATILSAFGFDNEAVPRDILGLGIVSVVCLVLGYVALAVFLVEHR